MYHTLMLIHLATVIPAFLLGTFLMLRRKGTASHRAIGKIYLCLMFFTASISVLMPADIGPQFLSHFGYIHILSVVTVVTVPLAWWAAKTERVILHAANMICLYVGGILVAGGLTLLPGRFLHGLLFGA